MMGSIRLALKATVEGDMSAFLIIKAENQGSIIHASASLPPLVITKTALVKVLLAFHNGDTQADTVQRWASFARRGYVSGNVDGVLNPIEIAYDKCHEDLIVDIIGRLDEIGDKIDGVVDSAELMAMLRVLE
jgi:hypothetical protein